ARHADAVIAAMLPASRPIARRVLVGLVDASGRRVRRTEAELTGGGAEAHAVVDALVRGRLLVAHDAEDGSAFELAHEVLIHGWGTLPRWREETAEGRAVRERLVAAAAEWERLGRPADAVWGPRRLLEAEALPEAELTPSQAAFLGASRRAERIRRWRR